MAFKRSAVRFCLSPLKNKHGRRKLFTMTSLRERSQVILWLLLFFFIASMTVGGLVGGANILDLILGRKNTNLYVGKIDGKSITRQEFEYERQIQLNRTTQQGGNINDQTLINAGNQAWNSIIESYIKDMKVEELGLTVYADEVYDYMQPYSFWHNTMKINDPSYRANHVYERYSDIDDPFWQKQFLRMVGFRGLFQDRFFAAEFRKLQRHGRFKLD